MKMNSSKWIQEAVWFKLKAASTFYVFWFFSFFFLCMNNKITWFYCAGDKKHCLYVHVVFMYCLYTVYGSHNTINIFKNYFALVFLVFSFQFSVSAIISSIQTDSKSSRKLQDIIFIDTHLIACERYDKCP